MAIIDNDLLSIQEARILAEQAKTAKHLLADFSQQRLDAVVDAMCDALKAHIPELARMSLQETGYGRLEDKLAKDYFVCENMRQALVGMKCVGFIDDNPALGIAHVGVPIGVIACLLPATNPVSTTAASTIIAVKSGNAVIVSPHPRACHTIWRTMDILNNAALEAGLPSGALSCCRILAREGTATLLSHPAVDMILATGVPALLPAARASGKPLIYGGSGSGPAFIERTADVDQAARDIIASKTFDYGVVSGAEHSVVVDAPVEEEARRAFCRHGAYFMRQDEAASLGACLVGTDGRINPEFVGISADRLASRAGFEVPQGTCLLIAEGRYTFNNNPYAREKLCPVLSWYIEDNWQAACEKCMELLIQKNDGHTLVIHSRDESVIRQFALKKPVTRVLVNTPAALGGMGVTTNLFPSMTLGSGMAGQGITSDNVGPMNLVYIRTVGRGVRSADSQAFSLTLKENQDRLSEKPSPAFLEAVRLIAELFSQKT